MLKRCPFCDSDMSSFAGMTPDAFAKGEGTFAINCECGATGPLEPTMQEAVDAWNTRAPAQAAPRCARCGSHGDTYVLCSGCGMPTSPPYPVESALRECASRCRYDGDLFHDQRNIERRDASWKVAEMAEAALSALSSTDRGYPDPQDRWEGWPDPPLSSTPRGDAT